MKRGLFTLLLCMALSLAGFTQKPAPKPPDTNGLAALEYKIDLFKSLLPSLSGQISSCNSLDSIRMFATIIGQLSDSLVNQMVPVFDGFYATHPDQYAPIKNISQLTDDIVGTTNLNKAKKYSQKISQESDNLMKAK